MSDNVIPIDIAQRRVNATLVTPNSEEDARDIAIHCLTEDHQQSLGVGLFPPPEGKAWLLTPDQADQLALTLVRCAAAARLRGCP